ncbi:hypothetical protein KC318_g10084 [Hortaea werneckii]|uniref:F-box domain-containing protein n=1 Tax=Hortaea werneckii TaxID=91943 RepID=A0A3M7BDC8_HORWE|nr:hypothetical protein KC334_g9683 [Hortaea werneckii]KAI7002886.1 hypothetical protein KC355_g9529 [Hortaea werneckii]KAI7660436.1 hypothetical protein KC318_g10084 [Hortaea werneckii]RMY05332.1 hypothetical protein D0867_10061 [Hortaea werneckii]RMY37696.1 hypothetical protein D0866_03096 [Hortaea werneckii]
MSSSPHPIILTLPPELLHHIFALLDWDRSSHLTPDRADILNVSLTCKHLRHIITPLLFRNVTLCLRWVDGELLEPALLRLRREKPELSRWIRNVHVHTAAGYRPRQTTSPPALAAPDDIEDWLSPELTVLDHESEGERKWHQDLHSSHRNRLNRVVQERAHGVPIVSERHEQPYGAEQLMRKLIMTTSYDALKQRSRINGSVYEASPPRDPSLSNLSPEEPLRPLATDENHVGLFEKLVKTWNWHPTHADRRRKRDVDALAVVMLCLPPTLSDITFEVGHAPDDAHLFALHVFAAILEVYNTCLEALTIIGSTQESDAIGKVVTKSHIVGLTNIRTLRLAGAISTKPSTRDTPSDAANPECWHALRETASSLRTLEFWNVAFTVQFDLCSLLQTAANFPTLNSIALRNVMLCTLAENQRRLRALHAQSQGLPSSSSSNYNLQASSSSETNLLLLLITLRRMHPQTNLSFSDLWSNTQPLRSKLTPSALHWLHTEAVPVGASLDFEREQRLVEDFETFLPLWEAEDGGRGTEAKEDRMKRGGELADAAMCSRWRQSTNVARDRGEWLTM